MQPDGGEHWFPIPACLLLGKPSVAYADFAPAEVFRLAEEALFISGQNSNTLYRAIFERKVFLRAEFVASVGAV